MSLEAMIWSLYTAPRLIPEDIRDPVHEDKVLEVTDGALRVLTGLADHANTAGRNAFPGVPLLAERFNVTTKTIRARLKVLELAGLIRRGDQRYVAHIRADRRPVVWDLAMTPETTPDARRYVVPAEADEPSRPHERVTPYRGGQGTPSPPEADETSADEADEPSPKPDAADLSRPHERVTPQTNGVTTDASRGNDRRPHGVTTVVPQGTVSNPTTNHCGYVPAEPPDARAVETEPTCGKPPPGPAVSESVTNGRRLLAARGITSQLPRRQDPPPPPAPPRPSAPVPRPATRSRWCQECRLAPAAYGDRCPACQDAHLAHPQAPPAPLGGPSAADLDLMRQIRTRPKPPPVIPGKAYPTPTTDEPGPDAPADQLEATEDAHTEPTPSPGGPHVRSPRPQ